MTAAFLRTSIVLLGLLLGSAIIVEPCLADDSETDRAGIFNLLIENDIFSSGSDGNYTHGTRLTYLSGEDVPAWVLRGAGYVPLFPHDGSMRVVYALGQNIYTPNDIHRSELIIDDRPYAGWLYAGVGLVAETRTPGHRRLDALEFNLGVVGPASLAEDVQKLVHRITRDPQPQGWQHQLKNELGVMLIYDRQWQHPLEPRRGGLETDLSFHLGGALGNVMTYAAAGATLRLGRHLSSDYGPPRIRPSLPGCGAFTDQPFGSWYLFAGVEGRVVLQNIFLDGNTIRDSHSVNKEPLVGDLQAGLVITWGDYRFSYTHILRTEEFTTQETNTQFGALSFSFRM